MKKHTGLLSLIALLAAVGAHAQSNVFATGNLHFAAKDMDMNGDNMISKDEFMQYGDKMWEAMAKGASTMTVADASANFARGNMKYDAKAMDTDHDGTISKSEFMTFGEKRFDKMKDKDGLMSINDATKYFATGNMHPDSH